MWYNCSIIWWISWISWNSDNLPHIIPSVSKFFILSVNELSAVDYTRTLVKMNVPKLNLELVLTTILQKSVERSQPIDNFQERVQLSK